MPVIEEIVTIFIAGFIVVDPLRVHGSEEKDSHSPLSVAH
jgi:hypothetical protein